MGEATGQGHSKTEAIAALDSAREARELAEAAERDAVVAARDAGASWARIGELYGLTKQGAQQRFKPGVRRARRGAADD